MFGAGMFNFPGRSDMDISKIWKKEKSGVCDEQYIELFSGCDFKERQKSMINQKDFVVSWTRLLQAKEEFKNRRFKSAIALCNSALHFGELGTETIPHAYFLRSECFFMLKKYENCVKDLDLAIKTNCATTEGTQLEDLDGTYLEERRNKFMKFMNKETPFEPKLSFKADANYPSMTNVLEIRENMEFGLHIVAKSDIAVGHTVVVEESFVSAGELTETGCETCQRTEMNFIACDKCVLALFCDENCKNQNLFHSYECGLAPTGNNDRSGMEMLTIQSVLMALSLFSNVDRLMEFVEGVIGEVKREIPKTLNDPESKYRFFLKLSIGKPEEKIHPLIQITAESAYEAIMELLLARKMIKSEKHKRFLMHLVMMHLDIVKCNHFKNVFVKDEHEQMLFKLFLISSLFNHSCAPNVTEFRHHNQKFFVTLRPIKKGEQLFITYVDFFDDDTISRRSSLEMQHEFICKCERCVPHCSEKDRRAMKTDKNYIFVTRSGFQSGVSGDVLKQKCETFLNTYGRLPWCKEMQFMMQHYHNACKMIWN